MVKRTDIDPIAEAEARIRLRYTRAKPVRQPAKSLGLAAQRIARKAIPEKGPVLSRLKLSWPDIVGEQIARFSRPEKLTSSKGEKTLTLKVTPAAAPMIQHQSETIRQRVSVAAGGTVSKIKIIQGQLGASTARKQQSQRARALSAEEQAALQASTATIEDRALRAAIVSLGEAVLSRER